MNLHLHVLLIIACGSLSYAYLYTFSTCPSFSGNRRRIEPATLDCASSKRVQQGSCPRGARFPRNSAKYSTMAMSASATWPPADRLSDYVTESYLVDYKKLAAEEKDWLSGVISSIKKTDPAKMEKADKHAFFINAYNLWTLHWVIRERKCPRWKGHVSTFAKARFFYWHKISTGQGKRNLYNFENKARLVSDLYYQDRRVLDCVRTSKLYQLRLQTEILLTVGSSYLRRLLRERKTQRGPFFL